jgi:hypothetical protein
VGAILSWSAAGNQRASRDQGATEPDVVSLSLDLGSISAACVTRQLDIVVTSPGIGGMPTDFVTTWLYLVRTSDHGVPRSPDAVAKWSEDGSTLLETGARSRDFVS